jgi:hypothetical protein
MDILPARRAALLDDDQQLDRSASRTTLRGLYYGFPAPAGSSAELYWLELDADELADQRNVTTVGGRIYRPETPLGWHYEIEAVLQSGDSTGSVDGEVRSQLDHDAEFFHGEIGYSLMSAWAPVLALQYDRASGDGNPRDLRNERFDTLYGARRFDFGPTGIYGPFARANLETLGVRAAFRPARRWRGMLAYRTFRLAAPGDAWTTTGLRDETGQSSDELGRQLETSFTWDPTERLSAETGAAYLAKGRFVKTVAGESSQPSTYFYTAISVSF